MTKLYNKDGVIDLIEDYIAENIDQIVNDYESAVISALENSGYSVKRQ